MFLISLLPSIPCASMKPCTVFSYFRAKPLPSGEIQLTAAASRTGHFEKECSNVSLMSAALVVGLSLLVSAGWIFGIDILTHGLPSWPAIHPLTAASCLLLGIAICVESSHLSQNTNVTGILNHQPSRIAIAFTVIVLLITAAQTLSYYLTTTRNLDVILFPMWSNTSVDSPSRMSLATSIMLFMLSFAITLHPRGNGPVASLRQAAVFVAATIALLSLLGHSIDARYFSNFFTSTHTSVLVLLLCVGASCMFPNQTWVHVLRGNGTAAAIVIWLLPVGVIVPLISGIIQVWLADSGLMDDESVTFLKVATFSYSIFAVALVVSSRVHKIERRLLQSNEDLNHQKRNLAATLRSIGNGVITTNGAGRISSMSRTAETMVGMSETKAIGRPLGEVLRLRDTESDECITFSIDSVGEGQSMDYANAIVLESHLGQSLEVRYTVQPIHDDAGAATGLVVALADISDIREAQREIESFSFSVSHDLRAPLRHISSYAYFLATEDEGELSSDFQDYVSKISDSCVRMNSLIDAMMSFTQLGRKEMQDNTIDLNQIVSEIIAQSGSDIGDREVVWKYAGLPVVYGDTVMVRQVFVNLISNALKYSRLRNPAVIEIGQLEPEFDNAVIFVRDNGVGFDSEYTHKLFGVFQRLHTTREYEGTGIGLANVKRIVLRHKGRVWCKGKIDDGATFYVTLPRKSAEKRQQEAI